MLILFYLFVKVVDSMSKIDVKVMRDLGQDLPGIFLQACKVIGAISFPSKNSVGSLIWASCRFIDSDEFSAWTYGYVRNIHFNWEIFFNDVKFSLHLLEQLEGLHKLWDRAYRSSRALALWTTSDKPSFIGYFALFPLHYRSLWSLKSGIFEQHVVLVNALSSESNWKIPTIVQFRCLSHLFHW